MKSGISQTHGLALVSINLYMRECKNIADGSRVIVISLTVKLLGLVLPSSIKLVLTIFININICTNFYQNIPLG